MKKKCELGADQSQHAPMPVPSETDRLKQLLVQSWAIYDHLHEQEFVVCPAIPILFFGDSKRYFTSQLRVVTVGLNPSNKEFPEDDQFSRFPAARVLVPDSGQRDHSCHLEALDAYFRSMPYKQWFNSFEPMLRGLGTSYYDGQESTALHTDFCSPIATNPTWRRLPEKGRSLLELDGINLWHSLVETLAPDVILISIKKCDLEKIRFPALSSWQAIRALNRKRPYQVRGRLLAINSSKRTLLAFGRAANTPFGTVSNVDKLEIGAAIKEAYSAFPR
jgi:hypothetical protein